MIARPVTHRLNMESGPVVNIPRGSGVLWDADCPCGEWKAVRVTAAEARGSFAKHLQDVAGPAAQARRMDG